MCGPHRGRFRAVNLSASGSYVFVIGRRGDMFTRLYDFDISGHDPVFFKLLLRGPARQGRRRADPAARPRRWVEQPKIPGTITSAISIHKVGVDAIHRILRVEGARGGADRLLGARRRRARARAAGRFHATGLPLTGRRAATTRAATPRRAASGAARTRATGCTPG